jgi:hypothetical protein
MIEILDGKNLSTKRSKEWRDNLNTPYQEDYDYSDERARQQDRWNRRKQKRRDFDDDDWENDYDN